MSGKTKAGLGVLLLLYLTWQGLHWLQGDTAIVGDLFFLPFGAIAVYACWEASRRTSELPGLRWFWRLMALAITAQFAGDAATAVYDLGGGEAPFPSLADIPYLALYPLLLLALVRVPVAPSSRSQRVRLSLDIAIAIVAGGMLIWYFVLAELLGEGGQTALELATSIAYPVGDLVLLAGLGILLLRWSPPIVRRPLALIAVGLALFIAADVAYSLALVRGGYEAGGLIDVPWIAALVLFALAAMNQAEARPEAPETAVPIREVIEERVSIFPFVALVVGSALLLHAELWDRSALVILIAAIGLVTLIAVRQFVTQAEMIRLEHALQAARDRLADLANQDTLTALPNRRAVETTLGEEIERAHRYEHRFSVLFLDIDHFKAINDALGHAVGDQVLSEFAAIVKVCLRPIDTLGRWGGEEFLAVLPETDAGEAVIAAERIRRRIDKHDFGLEGDMGPTCSIGVSSYPDDGLAVDALVHTADFAMYEAKRQGRNQVASAHHPAPTPA